MFNIDFQALKAEYDKLVEILTDAAIDRSKRAEVQKRVSILQQVLVELDKIQTKQSELESYQQELSKLQEAGDEFAPLVADEIENIKKDLGELEKNLSNILYPADEKANRPCFLEIRAGAGGAEASLFASELLKLYNLYAQQKGWAPEIHSINYTDLKGIREAILYVKGKSAYGEMKFESGVHRVQRVPATEGAGRIHTSTVTVAVLPEADEVDVAINANDIRIDTYRSSGAGGQHVNTTDSAIRVTHIPTGLVVTCQDERSQNKNKAKALKELRARLFEMQLRKAEEERSTERKSQIGSGDRSEKIRTYNFPQNRVTDHRIDLTLKKLDLVMEGDLDDIINALIQAELKEKMSQPPAFLEPLKL